MIIRFLSAKSYDATISEPGNRQGAAPFSLIFNEHLGCELRRPLVLARPYWQAGLGGIGKGVKALGDRSYNLGAGRSELGPMLSSWLRPFAQKERRGQKDLLK